MKISVEGQKIKIVGFKHQDVSLKLGQILEKIKTYEFPEHWEDIIKMINGEHNYLIFDLPKDSLERINVEIRFKLTM